MDNSFYEQISQGLELRSNLQNLRMALKDPSECARFRDKRAGDYSVLTGLLHAEDAKIRRNSVQILGMMEDEDLLPVLFDAYKKEKTRFIRLDYLEAMEPLDFEPYLDDLRSRLYELDQEQDAGENKKHRHAEMQQIKRMLLLYETQAVRRFIGFDYAGDVILTTNYCQREATVNQLPKGAAVLLRGGVRIHGVPLGRILPIRTYQELLLPVGTVPQENAKDPEHLGSYLGRMGLDELMNALYEGEGSYRYRIDCKLAAGDDRGDWIRKLSGAFEDRAGLHWVNAPSEYEIEIRLIPRQDGTCLVMLRPAGLAESRFDYRKESISSSIAPSVAALICELAKPWLIDNAQVLDPFCGTGAMLIERTKVGDTHSLYGLDTYADAIRKARGNSGRAGIVVNYIQRDFFTFRHEYLFDEIITDMPQVTRENGKEKISELYHKFFVHARGVLKPHAILTVYATEPSFLRREVRQCSEYHILKSFEINERTGTMAFVIERNAENGKKQER